MVTKSGTDRLHGSAFEFLRNTNLDARSYFSSERAKFDRNQFGGTLGGPIKIQADFSATQTVWRREWERKPKSAQPTVLPEISSLKFL